MQYACAYKIAQSYSSLCEVYREFRMAENILWLLTMSEILEELHDSKNGTNIRPFNVFML